ncbi:unnamed protein product [Prorocentrum cordatum]|uniref:Uncharacterized protein n=1 Tax=Prorocentrum cordatum TaxID=2364126 RepID=A0ABN9UR75_9DINO|nr:unnamed protein product [Polarella glacialis]
MAAPGRFWARFQGLRRAEGPAEPAAGAATTGPPAEVCLLAAAGGGTPGATAGAPDGGGSRGEAPSEEGPRRPPPEEGAGAPPEGPRDAGGFRHSGSVESQSLLSSYCSDYSDSKSSPRAGRRNSRGSSDAEVQLADDVHRFLEFAPVGKRRRGRRRVANQSRIRRGNSTLADALFDVPEDDEAVGKITMSAGGQRSRAARSRAQRGVSPQRRKAVPGSGMQVVPWPWQW